MWVKVEPLEPLMFRSRGEFDPALRSYVAETLLYPRPSTFAGMIGRLLLASCDDADESLPLEKLLKQCGVGRIYGPLLVRDDGEIMVPVRFEGSLFLVGYGSFKRELACLLQRDSSHQCRPLDYYLALERMRAWLHREDVSRLMVERRVGVGLQTRSGGGKVARENYLYSAGFVNYRYRDGGGRVRRISMFFKVECRGCLKGLSGALVNLGGENRVVAVKVDAKEPPAHTEILSLYDSPGEGVYLLLSPAVICSARGVEEYVAMGQVDVIPGGYSLHSGRRKRPLLAVLEGSVVKLGGWDMRQTGFLRDGGYRRLGYGTLIRVC